MSRLILAALCVVLVLVLVSVPLAEAAPAWLVQAIIKVESNGNPKAKGKHGEIGLMQVKCRTARSVGFKGRCSQLYHPVTNVTFGTAYLNRAIKRARGNWCKAASLYNRGIHARGVLCTAYGKRVLRVASGGRR